MSPMICFWQNSRIRNGRRRDQRSGAPRGYRFCGIFMVIEAFLAKLWPIEFQTIENNRKKQDNNRKIFNIYFFGSLNFLINKTDRNTHSDQVSWKFDHFWRFYGQIKILPYWGLFFKMTSRGCPDQIFFKTCPSKS